MTRMLGLVVIALGLVLLLFWGTQRRMIYYPFGAVPPPAAVGLERAESVTFQTEDGLTLNGWFAAPAAPATATRSSCSTATPGTAPSGQTSRAG